ncbi:LRCH2 protein, partial [Polypterus senegalus]
MKMAAAHGGGGAAMALQSQLYPNGPHWTPGTWHQQHHLHTARSLDRALEEAVCSGMLSLSGRKLRDFPGSSYDLTDTTQAGILIYDSSPSVKCFRQMGKIGQSTTPYTVLREDVGQHEVNTGY